MDIETIKRLVLNPQETAKVDFKIQGYKILEKVEKNDPDFAKKNETNEKQWGELIKDIVALTNGNVGWANETGYLIVGADEKLKSDGTPNLVGIKEEWLPSTTIILGKVNSYCNHRIPHLESDRVEVQGTYLWVIEIQPSPYLHSLSKQLKTPKKEYSPQVLLLRRVDGEETYEGSYEEYSALGKEKHETLPERLNRSAKKLDEDLERDPNNQEKLLNRATVAEQLDDFETMERMYEQLLLLNSDSPTILISKYSKACERMNKPEKALEILNRDTQPSPKTLEKKGLLLSKLDRSDEANESYSKAQRLYELTLHLNDYVTITRIGILLRSQGKYRESIKSFDRALKISPNYRAAKYEKKKSYYELFKGGL